MTEGIRADDRKLYEAKLRYEPQGKTKLSAVSIGFFLLTYMGILNLPLLFIYGLGDLISHGADVNYGIRIALKTAPFLLITHGPLLICRLGTDLQALQMKTRGRLISGLGCAYRTSFFAETTFRGRRCGVEALVCVRYLQPWFRCTTVVDVGTRATEPLFFQSNGLSAGRHAHKLQKLLPVLDEIVGKDELIQIMVEGSHLRAAIHGKTYDANVAATAGWLALSAREIIEEADEASKSGDTSTISDEPMPRTISERFGSLEREGRSPFLRHWWNLRKWCEEKDAAPRVLGGRR